MATRTRYKSPSPVPPTTAAKTFESTTPDALSASHFHAQYPRFQNSREPSSSSSTPEDQHYDSRFSPRYPGARKQAPDLPILSYHNAVPEHYLSSVPSGEPVPVVLPPVLPPNGNNKYASPTPDPSVGYAAQKTLSREERPRSLSIQSLISSPTLEPPPEKRKREGSHVDDGARSTRHASLVPTSVSIEDPDVREVVEALGGLKGDFAPTSPPLPHPQPHHPENEPLLNLITHHAHPLLSSAITTSLSAYGASKSYSASFRYAAESVENRVALPVSNVVSAVGRRTGLEGVLRRGLQRSATPERPDYSKKRKTREALDLVQSEMDGELESPTWHKRLMLSTSGLGVALNDESLKNLKYCLQWLRVLNLHLSRLVAALRSVVEELDNHQQQARVEGTDASDGPPSRVLPARESRRVQLAATVEGLKAEVVGTMKKVVEVVSNYTGSALPDNARDLIKRHIFALPQRFAAANAPPTSQLISTDNGHNDDESPRSSANRVLVLAKEGLDMMQQVSAVVEGTIVRAEEWCERLGKKKRDEDPLDDDGPEKKRVSWKKKFEGSEEGRRDVEGDVVMEAGGRLKN